MGTGSVVGRTLPFCHVAGQNWHCQADGRTGTARQMAELALPGRWQNWHCQADGRTGTARQMAEPPRQNVAEPQTVGAVKDVLYSVRLVYDSVN
jgi:hypothetical protein